MEPLQELIFLFEGLPSFMIAFQNGKRILKLYAVSSRRCIPCVMDSRVVREQHFVCAIAPPVRLMLLLFTALGKLYLLYCSFFLSFQFSRIGRRQDFPM